MAVILGSNFNDRLVGTIDNDSLVGGGGNDTYVGSLGNDQLLAGESYFDNTSSRLGFNTADYSSFREPITFYFSVLVLDNRFIGQGITLLPGGIVTKGRFSNIRNINNSSLDVLNGIQKIIAPGPLFGPRFDPRFGFSDNTINGSGNSARIIANLATNTLTVNDAGFPFPFNFQVSNFDNVVGTNFADSITGDFYYNRLEGGDGNDTIDGGAGNDTIDGGAGNDSLIGGDGDDTFIVSQGNDVINGGSGSNTVDYSELKQAITLKILGVVTKPGNLGTDSWVSIQNVIGTKFADSITGDSGNNKLDGGAGNDTLFGGDGDDTFLGSQGDDTVNGELGSNTADYGLLRQAITLKPFGVVEKAGNLGKDSLVKIQNIIASTRRLK
jgi:Ca2+-binding RTX toxin-like protein